MSQGVYVIANVHNGHRYVGSSVNIESRYREHAKALNNGTHHSRYLQHAWRKYGSTSFSFNVVEIVMFREHLRDREQWHIDNGDSSYNRSTNAHNSMAGLQHSDESKQKMRDATRRLFADPVFRSKWRCHEWSEESKRKLREARARQRSPMTGKQHTAETKARISEAKRGCKNPHGNPPVESICLRCGDPKVVSAAKARTRKYCKECNIKIAVNRFVAIGRSRRGGHITSEHKAAISAFMLGRKHMLGKKHSAETKLKMSLSHGGR